MKNYKDLIVWKKAHALVLSVYRYTSVFPKIEQYHLTSQLRRAATSVPTNLAEGSGKFTQADFARYIQISLGSAHEMEYLTFLSYELGYINDGQYKLLHEQTSEVKAMLIGLVNKVRKDSSISKG